ncbi:MAG: chromosome segregation protein SMC [Clostridia bacterium]|nr:chromosome segregation protein SMC [Clostridia bacterium]
MYLKSLEMQGFKSFPDKTKLVFENPTEVSLSADGSAQGVTVIVGPNGSGKSNIADAMRWVLGEISSKTLRGAKMEDVIFGGADSRRPMGYAEVSVTFDNRGEFAKLQCPYDEVMVTRRYYRSGDSEYFINRKGVRLKDIYELFMNTGIGRDGYSIIGQGRIAEMVSRKSEERRSVFEDASGIAKYRYKKNETERRLKDAEDNLSRTEDVFSVIAEQVGPLQKESEKAKRALELIEKKKEADVGLWLYDTEKLHDELNVATENMRHASYDLSAVEDAIQSLEAQNEKLYEAAQGSKQASERLLTEISEATERSHNLESGYRVAENTILHAKELIAETERSKEGILHSIEEGKKEIASHQAAEKRLSEEEQKLLLDETAANEESLRLTGEVTTLDGVIEKALVDLQALEKERMELTVRRTVLENSLQSGAERNQSAQTESEGYLQVAKELNEKIAEKKKTISGYDEQLGTVEKTLETLEGELASAEEALKAANDACNEAIFEKESVAHLLETNRAMEENLTGYSGAVRYIVKAYEEGSLVSRNGGKIGKIYGPLSQLVRVEDAYVTAVETALGNHLQHIVVEDEETAKSAMLALKSANAGRTTFFPLSSMKPEPDDRNEEAASFAGYVGRCDELVSSDKLFENVIASLLCRILVFDTIDHASAMAKATGYRVRAVTLDGQQINPGGSYTGGSSKKEGSLLHRAGEIRRLEAKLRESAKALKEAEEKLAAAKETLEALNDKKSDAINRKDLITLLRGNEQGQLETLSAKLDANETLLQKLSLDMKELEAAKTQYSEDILELQKEEKRLEESARELTAFRTEKDSARGDLYLRKEELGRKITDLQISLAAIKKDCETEAALADAARKRVESLESELLTLEGRINTQKEIISVKTLEMAENRKNLEKEAEELEKLNAGRRSAEESNLEFERKQRELAQKLKDRNEHKENVLREYTKCEAKLASLQENQDRLAGKLLEEYELTRADAEALGYAPVTKETRAQVLSIQTECKNKLRALGNVDLDAVSKYAEVKERYDYLDGQLTDMKKARDDLLAIIADLESGMKTAFVESFNQINEHFGKVFSELFGGGSAELSLSDPENILESGIEIKAAPPGKIIKNLMQLSGGEQAFIGVALFFAILQVNPTPFCILDEIEAALDEVNVERLANYIKRYSGSTQFIMITHRRGTMAAADRLYGITMPEHGISKVLTLDPATISKQKGEEWNGIFG